MKRVLRRLLSLPFLLVLGALGLYALGGFVVAPWWIKRELPQYLQARLNATGSIGDIAINPFTFTVDVRDLAITEAGGKTPAIAFDRLYVDFETSSLFRRAWTLAEITLEHPRLNLEVDANDALNLAKLAPKDAAPKSEQSPELPRLLLQKVALKQGRVTFTDTGFAKPATTRLEPIEFELHDLSTLPDQRGDYTLSAKLPAGGTLGWRGTVSLAPIASEGQIQIQNLKLATVWQFLQDRLLMEEPGGNAALSLQYKAGYSASRLAASAANMRLKVSDIAVRQKDAAEPAFAAGELALSGGTFSFAERKLQFAELALQKAFARTTIDAEGKANWAQLTAPAKDTTDPKPQAKPASGPAWNIGISAIHVSDVRLSAVDQGFVRPLAVDIARAGLQSALKVSVGAETAANIENIHVTLEDIHLSEAGAKGDLLTLASAELLGGTFDLAQKKFFAETVKLSKPVTAVTRETNGAINLATAFARKQIKPPEPSTMVAEIQTVELSDGAVSFQDRSSAPALAYDFQGIRVQAKNVSSAAKATIPFDAALQIKQGGTLRAQGQITPDQSRATVKLDARNIALLPLASLLEKLTSLKLVSGAANAAGQLDWNGQGNNAGVRYAGSAGIEALRFAQTAADASATGAAQDKQGGSLRMQGTVSTASQLATLKVELRNVGLTPLAPLLAKHAALKLSSGSAHATGQLDWSGQGKRTGVRYAGSAGVDNFQLDREGSGDKLVAWKALLAEGIQVDSAGKLARIDDVRLSAPSGKIAIAKDRSTNLTGIMRTPAATPSDTASKAPAVAASTTSDAPFTVNVERVHVNDGELDFADQSLVLPFAAVVHEFTGTITGLSTQPGTRAGLKLEGRVDEFGQARVDGTINMLEPRVFTDLAVSFRNVAMSPLTPYSATFAGRRIASGKLSLDLQYKLINSQLLGENKVLLEQFTLGERVESPTAMSLPLDLAIALLTDSSGKIDLSVPVRGNVDSPEFAYGHLVWQAIRTVLTNIVTAPFRALASLFGGSAEKVDAIGFEAGRAQLAPPEREKLVRVAGVLKQRPQLRLMVEGRYDPRHDGAALRTTAARQLLAERQGIKPSGSDDPAPVNFDNAKTQRAIEALLEERAGADSIDKFKAGYEKSTGKEAKRVNAALALIGRGSTDREFYEAMFRRVAELQPLADTALRELARQRGAAIVGFMGSNSGLDAARIVAKPPASVSADKPAEIATALSLDTGK